MSSMLFVTLFLLPAELELYYPIRDWAYCLKSQSSRQFFNWQTLSNYTISNWQCLERIEGKKKLDELQIVLGLDMVSPSPTPEKKKKDMQIDEDIISARCNNLLVDLGNKIVNFIWLWASNLCSIIQMTV